MVRISRVTIWPDLSGITPVLDRALVAVMAGLAHGLQPTQPEFVPITTMGLDVIDYGCRLAAYRAPGCFCELRFALAFPAREIIPAIPVRVAAHFR
jgi:hypothetical protein